MFGFEACCASLLWDFSIHQTMAILWHISCPQGNLLQVYWGGGPGKHSRLVAGVLWGRGGLCGDKRRF